MRLKHNRSHALGKAKWQKAYHLIEVDIEADATLGQSVEVPFPLTVVGMRAISTAANASATVQLGDGTNAITDALDIAVLDAVDKAASIDLTYANLSVGDSLVLTTNGAADRAKVLIEVLPR